MSRNDVLFCLSEYDRWLRHLRPNGEVTVMKIVVIGGSGLIGSKLVKKLREFFEFVKSIVAAATEGNTVRVPPVLFQPVAADDVASAVGRIAVGPPLNGTVEVAGPERFRLDDLV